MKVVEQPIDGLFVLEPTIHADGRGAFFEAFNERQFADLTGVDLRFVQDNQSISHKGVLRGLHFQISPHAQGKLVRVVAGRIFDVAVDIRQASPTFGKWFGLELSARNRLQLWIPEGFAHGFLSLEDGSEVLYKTTDFWHGPSERVIQAEDPTVGVTWPEVGTYLFSDRDRDAPFLYEAVN